jgi:hypothetical protein
VSRATWRPEADVQDWRSLVLRAAVSLFGEGPQRPPAPSRSSVDVRAGGVSFTSTASLGTRQRIFGLECELRSRVLLREPNAAFGQAGEPAAEMEMTP